MHCYVDKSELIMDIKDIDYALKRRSIVVERIEHNFTENQLIITYREPSNRMYLCDPPKPVPDSIYRVVYGVEGCDLCALDIQVGREKVTPERREVVYT